MSGQRGSDCCSSPSATPLPDVIISPVQRHPSGLKSRQHQLTFDGAIDCGSVLIWIELGHVRRVEESRFGDVEPELDRANFGRGITTANLFSMNRRIALHRENFQCQSPFCWQRQKHFAHKSRFFFLEVVW